MTEIQLHNTRTRRKEPFRPLIPGRVRMYVCGPTVYDRAHIGNARPVVVFDVLYRLLHHVYGEDAVTYVRNFTDVDDKIIARAQETLAEGETLEAACHRITGETISWYREDMAALGALPPTHEPRCTEYIPEMVAMIGRLIAEGCAYPAEGHVLFDVTKYPDYGRLSRRSLEDMQAGARVEVAPYKKNPMDFVLWKPSTPEQPGWPSPWGRGRPGWHIECSAMAQTLLDETFDIHAGGIDLLFPHHENEVAQSCCANHTEVMANFWLHNGFLQVEGEKMAKSLGNFFTVKDLLDKGVPGEVIRWLLLKAHYRKPLNWTEDALIAAEQELIGLLDFPMRLAGKGSKMDGEVVAALADDLNFPAAMSRLHALRHDRKFEILASTLNVLGFTGEWLDANSVLLADNKTADRIESLLEIRSRARATRDFAKADAIRGFLEAAGVIVEDAEETTWKVGGDKIELGWLGVVKPAENDALAISLDEVLSLAESRGVSLVRDGKGWTAEKSGTWRGPIDVELIHLAEREAAR
ncbi:MAG TPA: cysteine--tRNA ligase [Thermohalobaculum sp.]|nr:cysteine--tRNA ligase [Thermohalobaculum sp.]